MIILIDTEKALDKIQYTFIIKKKSTNQQIRNRRKFPQNDKGISVSQISIAVITQQLKVKKYSICLTVLVGQVT